MALTTKSLLELEALVRASLRNLIPGADVSIYSDYDISARIAAAIFTGNQEQALYLVKQIFPTKAEEAYLLLHAEARGIERQPAARSQGAVLLTANAAGLAQADASELTHSDETAYSLVGSWVTALPAFTGKTVGVGSSAALLVVAPNVDDMVVNDVVEVGGHKRAIKHIYSSVQVIELYIGLPAAPTPGTDITAAYGVVAAVIADELGDAGSKPVGDYLTLTSPTSGIDEDALIVEMGGGGDVESFDDLRSRVVAHDADKPASGNPADYRELARTTPGVRLADAIVYPNFRGRGTIDIIPIGLEGVRVTPASVNALVQAHLEAESNFAQDIHVLSMAVDPDSRIPVTMVIEPEVGYEPDNYGAITGAEATATGIAFFVDNPITEGFAIGHRILIRYDAADRPFSVVRRIVSISSSSIVVDQPLPYVIGAGTIEVSGAGPNTEATLGAILALFDRMGPGRRLLGVDYDRHPDPTVEWEPILKLAEIYKVVMGVEGNDNVTLSSPVADQIPPAQTVFWPATISITYAAP